MPHASCPLEYLWLRVERFGLQRVVTVAIEIPGKIEMLLLPDALQAADKLLRAQIALFVIEPRLANRLKFTAEPAADDIDRDTGIGQMADGGDLFRRQRGIPRAGQQRGNHLELFSCAQQSLRETD